MKSAGTTLFTPESMCTPNWLISTAAMSEPPTTDLELAEVDLADRIADGERQEERRLRHALEYGMDEIHQRRSPASNLEAAHV